MKNNTFKIALLILLVSFLYIISPQIKQHAFALQGSYNRLPSDDTLTVQDWNYLDDDFLLKSGDTMSGNLNMGSNYITNLGMQATPGNNDAVTVQYVTNAISAAGSASGGDIYVVWGSTNCGTNNSVYTGYAFSAPYNFNGGSGNPVCINTPNNADYDFLFGSADNMVPLVTSLNDSYLPIQGTDDPNSRIREQSFIQCAVCHNTSGVCYEHIGEQSCANGFASAYNGYMLGSYTTSGTDNHRNSTSRACVDSEGFVFNDTQGYMGAMWYGSKIDNNSGLPYGIDTFVKCSLCCS